MPQGYRFGQLVTETATPEEALTCSSPEDAAAHLADAARGFTGLGATGDAARRQHRLRELGVPTWRRPGRRGHGTRLSPRELEVPKLLARGATNQDIAQTLFLSPRTVEKDVARVLAKLRTGWKDIQSGLPNSDRPGSLEPASNAPNTTDKTVETPGRAAGPRGRR